ncbi:MAG: hypothetical protein WC211_03695 [Dehalococcoidia bacterium]
MTNERHETTAVTVASHETTAVELWGTDDPLAMVNRMTAVADAMAAVVRRRGLVQTFTIKGKTREYVNVEGWSLVGAMIGVFPRTRDVEEIRVADGSLVGFKANVDLVTREGGVVGGSSAICTRDEERWADRDWNQISSMAQTRATAKAFRMSFGFVMPMAGYEATPAEEMDGIGAEPEKREASPASRTAGRRVDTPDQAKAFEQERSEARAAHPEKRNGVSFVPAVESVGSLFQWARYEYNLTSQEVVAILGGKVQGDIHGIIKEKYNGSWEGAQTTVSASVEPDAAPVEPTVQEGEYREVEQEAEAVHES